jgi:hypothetical protein
LKSCEDSSEFFQPANRSFHDVSLAVQVTIEFDCSRIPVFIPLRWNDGIDAQLKKVFVNPLGTVPLVTANSYRPRDGVAVTIGHVIDRHQQRSTRGPDLLLNEIPEGVLLRLLVNEVLL